MATFTATLLLSTIPAILVGLATAWISVGVALRRFRNERWFERKADTYVRLFEALTNLRRNATVQLERIEAGVSYREEYLERMAKLAGRSVDQLRTTAAMGEFLFGVKAAARLQQLEREVEKAYAQQGLHDRYFDLLGAVTSAIDDLRPLAKADLTQPWLG